MYYISELFLALNITRLSPAVVLCTTHGSSHRPQAWSTKERCGSHPHIAAVCNGAWHAVVELEAQYSLGKPLIKSMRSGHTELGDSVTEVGK